MIYKAAGRAALLAAVLVGGCQTYTYAPQPQTQRTQLDGRWASTDGVFVADFQGGTFTSRFTQTNEILAQGTYTVSGPDIGLSWISVQAQEQRTARCSFTSGVTVACVQPNGSTFTLQRMA